MSRLDKLIAELCPDGVEFLTFKDIVEKNIGGGTPSKAKPQYWNGDIPWASVKDVVRAGMFLTNTLDYITEEGLRNSSSSLVPKGWLIFCTRINPGLCAIAGKNIAINQDLRGICFREIVDVKFIWYYFQTLNIVGKGTTVKGISIEELDRIKIPIPPLPVQQEIVRILDQFTALEAELEAELEARKKQYEYYRDLLLTFDDTVEWMTISDVCKSISSGGTPQTSRTDFYNGGGIPWLRTQEVDWNEIYDTSVKITESGLANSSAQWIPPNCVIVAMYGATAAKVAINKIPLTTNQACCNLEVDQCIAYYQYVFHWLSKEYHALKSQGRGSQSNINSTIVKAYPIPVPPLAEQERIVAILDRFDALVNDITQGLPAEIAARRKQYEYYRDQLLTFKEAAS